MQSAGANVKSFLSSGANQNHPKSSKAFNFLVGYWSSEMIFFSFRTKQILTLRYVALLGARIAFKRCQVCPGQGIGRSHGPDVALGVTFWPL